MRRERILLQGIVQGVGFRPFVYRLARECGLSGFVYNDNVGVVIEVEGPAERLEIFGGRLLRETPPLARIVGRREEALLPTGETGFAIRASRRDADPAAFISPDVAVCDACLRELFDPSDRRCGYAFINCTNCGPRYTITRRIPYDRPNTSMAPFPLCADCLREYEDPADRRFHAQPNACPRCGPRLEIRDREGRRLDVEDPIAEAVRSLREGRIVAVRGLGGFHLAADARNERAVSDLRLRKGRRGKPFAMMAPDVASVERHCRVSGEERRLLLSAARPILLLERRAPEILAPSVAPGSRYFGFMLPSAPLHHLILRGGFDALVMTSGNHAEEPIAIGNEEALDRLAPLADLFLLHDREILQRCDDSIVQVVEEAPVVLRRSRGFVPAPVLLKRPVARRILACGGELKSTIALARGDAVFFSQHVGDLDNPQALRFFEESVAHLTAILTIDPEAIAHDLHPDYLSTRWAAARSDRPRVAVQHHHAHLASVMAENGVSGDTIGILLDGTGYGPDGTIWGGEVLAGGFRRFIRHAWLQPLRLPGGDAAIREPWRMALSALHAAFGREGIDRSLPPFHGRRSEEVEVLFKMIEGGFNSPMTSSCGRLFDAVSALLGIRARVDYEAQAAIELEAAIDEAEEGLYEEAACGFPGAGALPTAPLVRAVALDVRAGVPAGRIAARFHRTLPAILARAAESAREAHRIDRVALSGGVFQNAHILRDLSSLLRRRGFEVLTHRDVPPNDGGLALGQVMVADAMLSRD